MIQLRLHSNGKSDGYDTVFSTERYGREYVRVWVCVESSAAAGREAERKSTNTQE